MDQWYKLMMQCLSLNIHDINVFIHTDNEETLNTLTHAIVKQWWYM